MVLLTGMWGASTIDEKDSTKESTAFLVKGCGGCEESMVVEVMFFFLSLVSFLAP